MFKAFRLCLHHKMSSPSAIKYLYGFEEDLIRLCDEINGRTYRPSTSTTFVVTNPKPREVFAANFRDRIIHHYIAMRIEPLFEAMFTPRTFNCRKGKGVLYGVNQLRQDVYDCSEGYTRDCWIMRLDLRGFFMSIDKPLLDIMLQKFIEERYEGEDKADVLWLTHVTVMQCPEKNCTRISPIEMWDLIAKNKSLFTNGDRYGLPIGNLSSQHFANFLLHRLDMAIEKLGFVYHGRYVDDFYIIGDDKQKMLSSVAIIRRYLKICLRIELHPDKFYIQHYTKGVKFTGAVVKPGRAYPGERTVTNLHEAVHNLNKCFGRKQIEKGIQSVNSYLGLMKHFDAYHIKRREMSYIVPHVWDWIFIRGHFHCLCMRRFPRKKPARKEDYLKTYYANELNDHEIPLREEGTDDKK